MTRTGAGTCLTPRAGLSLSAFAAQRKATRVVKSGRARHGSEGTVAEVAASRTNSGLACTERWLEGRCCPAGLHQTKVVTQTARYERISHTRLTHLLSAVCGDHARFC